MEKLIEALGLDIKILLSQLLNFIVLVFLLYKFGYKPMLNFLDERKDKIEQGVKNAQKAQDKLAEMEEKEIQTMKDAKKEALAIIEAAKNVGEEKADKIIKKAKEEIGEIINVEKEKMRVEKAETLKEIKKDVADLIVFSLEKVLLEGMDEKRDKEIIKNIVKELK